MHPTDWITHTMAFVIYQLWSTGWNEKFQLGQVIYLSVSIVLKCLVLENKKNSKMYMLSCLIYVIK